MFTSIIRFHSSILSSASGESGMTPALFNDHVNLAELLQREIRERLHIGEVGHIERTILCRASGCANFGGQFLQPIGAAGTEHDTVSRAVFGPRNPTL